MKTALLDSPALAKRFGWKSVNLKLENTQQTGSFKDRALTQLLTKFKKEGAEQVVCSSGGNAGVACAYAGKVLNLPAKIFLPVSTRPMVLERLQDYGAEFELVGKNWHESDSAARKYIEEAAFPVTYAPPFDHPSLWEGNSNIMKELIQQYEDNHLEIPDEIICSVGGGGLLGGILLGLSRNKAWNDKVKVVAVETEGTRSLHESMKAGKSVKLDQISGIAHSLGSPFIANGVLEMVFERQKRNLIESIVVPDRAALNSCRHFLDDHRFLVEPACGASLAALEPVNRASPDMDGKSVAVVVCGGGAMTLEVMEEYEKVLEAI